MKRIVLLFTLLGSLSIFSQKSYTFSYDTAGNQIEAKRYIYITAVIDPMAKHAAPAQDTREVALEESLTYYPNPVWDILFLRWTNTDTESISSFKLYSMTGALLQKHEAMEQNVEYSIPFSEYPSGAYIVTISYTSGEERSVKIIKN